MAKKKTPKWFYAILISIPIIIIILLEIVLQVLNYGKDLRQWVEITDNKLILNPDIGARYFSNIKDYPHSNHDSFDKDKKSNSFRVFVFGGSSTAGFPYQPNGSFARYLRDRLILSHPENEIEVINLGITAINSYTILDLLPEVIDQNPDLVIIYAGHNEFYGALGVGSTESIGNSQELIRLFLFLNKFKTTQLLKSVITSLFENIASGKGNSVGNTLMARMASEKAIKLNSSLYQSGVEQFDNNLAKILSSLKQEGIPTTIGTLASNLLDQKPFISFNEIDSLSAIKYYNDALYNISLTNYEKANLLLKNARDYDGLRFRAPSRINKIIKEHARKYECSIVDIEEVFNKISPNGIVGNNLFVDHLHPTLNGHHLIGKLFYNEIILNNFLPSSKTILLEEEHDFIVRKEFAFSDLDSIASHFRILGLLNDWPFTKEKKSDLFNKNGFKSKIESLALRMVKENLNWEIAHQEAYKFYLSNNQLTKFVEEINVLVSQYPYKLEYYNFAAQELISRKYFDEAESFLSRRYNIDPDDYSTKWLGNINLFNDNINDAVKYLKESIKVNPYDAQVFFNLTIAYLKSMENEKAYKTIQECLKLDSAYPKAKQIYNDLSRKIKKPA
jgi:tetratricopeptide (TPR) repeat protein